MENQEHVLATADIRYVKTKLKNTTIVFLVVVAISLVIGIISATNFGVSPGGKVVNPKSDRYGQHYPASDYVNIGWFGLNFYRYFEGWKTGYFGTYWYPTEKTHVENIIIVIVIYVFLFSLPAIVNAIFKRECKDTALTITDSQVYGSYNNFLFKKSFKMPIEKVYYITIISGLMDKFRSGVTLGVYSASGIIKLHFVQNADEVIAAAIGRIEEIKEKEKRVRVVAQQIPINTTPHTPYSPPSNAGQSAADELKKYKELKDQGVITEEEFLAKKEQLLKLM